MGCCMGVLRWLFNTPLNICCVIPFFFFFFFFCVHVLFLILLCYLLSEVPALSYGILNIQAKIDTPYLNITTSPYILTHFSNRFTILDAQPYT